MTQAAPGKAFRRGLTIFDLMEMFPAEDAARKWFEARVWPEGRACPYCGSARTIECRKEASHPLPYRCHDCQRYFSVKTGTLMERSPLPLRKWVLAIYLHMTSLKGVSSMKLHRDIGVTQKTAWFMLRRIREVFRRDDDEPPMGGPDEVDETYVGGIRANRSNAERKAATGRGTVDMTAVVGMKDRDSRQVRAQVVQSTGAIDLIPFVAGHAARGSTVYTDDHGAYGPQPDRPLAHLGATARWDGTLLGLTRTDGRTVRGDAAITADFERANGRADFTALESWPHRRHPGSPGTGTQWGDGDLGYTLRVWETGRLSGFDSAAAPGDDPGVVTGVLVGTAHEGAVGVLEHPDLAAAFGGLRE